MELDQKFDQNVYIEAHGLDSYRGYWLVVEQEYAVDQTLTPVARFRRAHEDEVINQKQFKWRLKRLRNQEVVLESVSLPNHYLTTIQLHYREDYEVVYSGSPENVFKSIFRFTFSEHKYTINQPEQRQLLRYTLQGNSGRLFFVCCRSGKPVVRVSHEVPASRNDIYTDVFRIYQPAQSLYYEITDTITNDRRNQMTFVVERQEGIVTTNSQSYSESVLYEIGLEMKNRLLKSVVDAKLSYSEEWTTINERAYSKAKAITHSIPVCGKSSVQVEQLVGRYGDYVAMSDKVRIIYAGNMDPSNCDTQCGGR